MSKTEGAALPMSESRKLCAACTSQLPELVKRFRERSPLGGSFVHECSRCGFVEVIVGESGPAWVEKRP